MYTSRVAAAAAAAAAAVGWPRWTKLAETFGTSAFPISLTKLIRNLQENVKKVAV